MATVRNHVHEVAERMEKGTWGGESVFHRRMRARLETIAATGLAADSRVGWRFRALKRAEVENGRVVRSDHGPEHDGGSERRNASPSSTPMNPLLPGLIGDGVRCNKLASIRTGRIISTCPEHLPSSVSFWTTAWRSMIASSRKYNVESTLVRKGPPLCCSDGCLNT
jgi:hypothetical protein